MKSQFQTLSFLSNYIPKSSLDAEMIESFLEGRFNIAPKTAIFAPNSASNPIDAQSFISWFERGLEALKIARFENQTVLLGNCTLERCEIIGTLLDDNSIKTDLLTADVHEIDDATEDEIKVFQSALVSNKLQPDPKTLRLVQKYFPEPEDHVIFYDFALKTRGVGVVMKVDPVYDVMFFCCFLYPNHGRQGTIKYAFREFEGYNLLEYVFENIDTNNVQCSFGNTTSCFHRLQTELEKRGKVWRDKLHRVDPIKGQLPKGSKYYYINDRMEVRDDVEKLNLTSRRRWIAGNYFYSRHAADLMNGELRDLLLKFMASDDWDRQLKDEPTKKRKNKKTEELDDAK